jgi:hypothetical protein
MFISKAGTAEQQLLSQWQHVVAGAVLWQQQLVLNFYSDAPAA